MGLAGRAVSPSVSAVPSSVYPKIHRNRVGSVSGVDSADVGSLRHRTPESTRSCWKCSVVVWALTSSSSTARPCAVSSPRPRPRASCSKAGSYRFREVVRESPGRTGGRACPAGIGPAACVFFEGRAARRSRGGGWSGAVVHLRRPVMSRGRDTGPSRKFPRRTGGADFPWGTSANLTGGEKALSVTEVAFRFRRGRTWRASRYGPSGPSRQKPSRDEKKWRNG